MPTPSSALPVGLTVASLFTWVCSPFSTPEKKGMMSDDACLMQSAPTYSWKKPWKPFFKALKTMAFPELAES
jgi:hypothetical protein